MNSFDTFTPSNSKCIPTAEAKIVELFRLDDVFSVSNMPLPVVTHKKQLQHASRNASGTAAWAAEPEVEIVISYVSEAVLVPALHYFDMYLNAARRRYEISFHSVENRAKKQKILSVPDALLEAWKVSVKYHDNIEISRALFRNHRGYCPCDLCQIRNSKYASSADRQRIDRALRLVLDPWSEKKGMHFLETIRLTKI